MSIFNPPSAGGGGITPEQLDQLVSDGELSEHQAAILSAILTRSSSEALADARSAILAAISGTATAAQLNAAVEALTEALGTPITEGDLAAVQSALESAIASATSGLATIQVAAPGEVRRFVGPVNEPPPGWTVVSGLTALPGQLFSQARITVAGDFYTQLGRFGLTVGGNHIYSASTWCGFNADTNSIVPLPVPLTGFTSQTLEYIDGKLYAFRLLASGNSNTSAAVRVYDTATNAWESLANVPGTAHSRASVLLPDGRVLLAGGTTSNHYSSIPTASSVVSTAHIYDPATNTFTDAASMPVAAIAWDHAITLQSGNVVVFLKRAVRSGSLSNQVGERGVLLYDPVEDAWSVLDDCPVASEPLLQWATPDGKLAHVPASSPGAGARGRLLDPEAEPGSQWSDLDVEIPSGGIAIAPARMSTSVISFYLGDTSKLLAYFLPPGELPATTWSALYYAKKD